MIKWYKPSEKMPKVGDEILLLKMKDYGPDLYFEEMGRFNTIAEDCYWTYAKDFNFPVEQE